MLRAIALRFGASAGESAALRPWPRKVPIAARNFNCRSKIGLFSRHTCVLRAHGHEPAWTTNGKFGEGSRAALRAIDLHFHDLRHEAGSRWLEAGMPLHHIKELLGHANISQTDTYLNAGRIVLQASIGFDAFRGKSVANEPTTENRPPSHKDTDASSKDLLH